MIAEGMIELRISLLVFSFVDLKETSTKYNAFVTEKMLGPIFEIFVF